VFYQIDQIARRACGTVNRYGIDREGMRRERRGKKRRAKREPEFGFFHVFSPKPVFSRSFFDEWSKVFSSAILQIVLNRLV
jgi:hypothetical protein